MGRILGIGLSTAAAAPLTEHKHGDDDFEGTPVWVLYVASMALVLLGGAFAGLTIAYVLIGSPQPPPLQFISQPRAMEEVILLSCFFLYRTDVYPPPA